MREPELAAFTAASASEPAGVSVTLQTWPAPKPSTAEQTISVPGRATEKAHEFAS